jgi:hypothetical protein
MKRAFCTILFMLALLGVAAAQTPGISNISPTPIQVLGLPLLSPPVGPGVATVSLTGAQGPSSNTIYYWIVADFPIGNSNPAGPFAAFQAPATLSGSNFETVSWFSVAGAVTYDVLKTTTPQAPSGACACAVVVATSNLSVNDQSNSTSAYTVNTFNPASDLVILDNEATGVLGISGLTARQGISGTLFGYSDSQYVIIPSDCVMFATAGAFVANSAGSGGLTGPAMVRVAANNWVLQGITSAAANSIALNCDVNPMTRSTAGRGAKITAIQLFYGVQTTALTSITPPTLSTITYPATGAAAGATVASAGGTLTVTPGALQLATTASGVCYSENISLGTPITLNSALQRLNLEQIFNQTAAAATQLQFCGAVVYYTNIPM